MNNTKAFVIFIAIALLIYSSINYYVYCRIIQAASLHGPAGLALKLFILFCILAYPLSRAPYFSNLIAGGLEWIGAFWLAVMTYSLLIVFVLDVLWLSDLLLCWFPNSITANAVHTGRVAFAVGAALVTGLLIVGRLIALNPVVRTVDIPISRLPVGKEGYRIVEFSDIHLGALVGERFLNRLVDKANSLNPDLILIPGDIVDEPPKRIEWAIEPLRRLKARDGVMACMGNHEYYAGPVEAMRMFERAGILLLKDKATVIPGTAVIAGMDDITASRQFGQKPVPVKSYTEGLDQTLPLIVMDHTPLRLQEAREAGVDLLISGHAHGGQLWPFDYVTRLVYHVHRGLTRFGKMNFFLGVGVGTWGPPIRIGATPEIVVMVLKRR